MEVKGPKFESRKPDILSPEEQREKVRLTNDNPSSDG